ncbi:hypothetical protein G5I_11150 [Acromyrmex echinatior]|uniref:Uncharacterized protein n=1 Tax=Acromyrmex echinatior TaxID=103372 RepID=F4WYT6_ACREC|nr:hypothetical protein G5I_11150 [Acromyrmex echinatior]
MILTLQTSSEAFSSDERKQTEQDSANGSSTGRLGFVLQRAVKLSHGSRRSSRGGQLFKRDAEIRDQNAARGRGWGGKWGDLVDKTKSLLTGTESKAEERQRAAREKIKRDIGQNSEKDDRTKRERNEGKKSTHSPPAGLDETHACDPILMAYHNADTPVTWGNLSEQLCTNDIQPLTLYDTSLEFPTVFHHLSRSASKHLMTQLRSYTCLPHEENTAFRPRIHIFDITMSGEILREEALY